MSVPQTAAPRTVPLAANRLPPIVWIAAGAIALRIALLFGRGDYVAFDEGWYLLLGRNLWSGGGYTLSGLEHVALSPLFPMLSGALGVVIGDPVWAGRLVAAVAAGLVVVPCWSVFRRLAGDRVATVGVVFVALLPSLAPFVVPYWIGWDLWVGAEPLLHLFVFTGLALLLRAWDERSLWAAVACGVAFALAYLARPEALGVFGVAGILALVLTLVSWRRRGVASSKDGGRARGRWTASRPWCFTACAVAFVAVSTPYWLYLHDTLGRWAITGRWVQVIPPVRSQVDVGAASSSNRIEDMLWRGDEAPYIRSLYSLDASGTRLANGYWGVQPREGVGVDAPAGATESPGAAGAAQASGSPADSGRAVSPAPTSASTTAAPAVDAPTLGPLRYAEALGVVVPWYLWLFVVVGLVARMRERRLDIEALVGIPLVVTSLVIARTVAIDPRTQLFLAPLAAFYAAAGVLVVGDRLARRTEGRIRGEMAPKLLVGALALVLLGTSLVRLGLSLAVGSPHHIVAAENATVGEAIRRASPEGATVVSFHPALALFADRDWRVLPVEPMDRIVRYARAQPGAQMVLSVFYPPQVREAEEPHYIVVPVPPDLPESRAWRIHIDNPRTVYAFGELIPLE